MYFYVICMVNLEQPWKYHTNYRCSPLHESYLSLSSSETDWNEFSLVLHCVRYEKKSTIVNCKKAHILYHIAIHDKTIYLISPGLCTWRDVYRY